MQRQAVILLGVIIIVLLILSSTGKLILLPQIDFLNYTEAAIRLVNRTSPYLHLEYFSPPWFAILIIPIAYLPVQVGMFLWLMLNIIGNFMVIRVWDHRYRLGFEERLSNKVFRSVLFSLAPPSLFCYITGQSTILMFLSLTALFLSFGNSWWISFIAFIGITIKPHLATLTFFLYLADRIRKGETRVLIWIGLWIVSLSIISTFFYPNWLEEWLQALLKGDYRGGSGLVSAGYFGFREAGVPIWLLILPSLYVIFTWYKEGLTPYVLSFSLISNLLIIPYHRAYDYILLYPACLLILAHSTKSTFAIAAKFLALLSILVIPLSPLVLLSPVSVLIALLMLRIGSGTLQPSETKESLIQMSTGEFSSS